MTENGVPMILCADIGGSNTRLAQARLTIDGLQLSAIARYHNHEAGSLAELLRRFLLGTDTPASACFAVAGPTDGSQVRLTNLDWEINAHQLSDEFGFPIRLINDFEAVAWGLDAVMADHLASLQPANPIAQAPRLTLGPGTGLGVAHSVWQGSRYSPLPGEGGHIAFAPCDDEQSALLGFLGQKYGRVSVERILSGPGLSDLFAYCRMASGHPAEHDLTPAEVSQAALDRSNPVAVQALQLFCRILGQTAGDLALVTGSRGGVYLAGGIPPRILPLLQNGEFLAGFRAKGRFSNGMRAIPIHVVTDPDIGLKGAALAAI
jgi:glucokinase